MTFLLNIPFFKRNTVPPKDFILPQISFRQPIATIAKGGG